MEKPLFSYNQGSIICSQGEEAMCFYILRKGGVDIIYNLDEVEPDPQEVCNKGKIVTEITAEGSIIGEAGLFLGYRTASLRASIVGTELEHVPLTENSIEKLIKAKPAIGLTLCRSLAGRIKHLSAQIKEAAFANMNINSSYSSLALAFINMLNKMEHCQDAARLVNIIKSAKEHPLYEAGMLIHKERSDAMTVFNQALSKKRAGNMSLNKGTELCREGDIGRALYFINEGEMEVRIAGQRVARLGAGEVVGEIAVLLKENPQRTASLKAIEDCKITTISALDFSKTVMEHPNILVSLGYTMSRRIHSTNRMVVDLEVALGREISQLSGGAASCEHVFRQIYDYLPDDTECLAELKEFSRSSADRAAKTADEMRNNYESILKRTKNE
ncbi:MAG: cyclic nucleotide-binding domain-containing protein [Planctomycetota bacterium]|jgi:CRP-like cAMP-binding protein